MMLVDWFVTMMLVVWFGKGRQPFESVV